MGFNEWVTLATVLLSVVSVGIAIYSARSTSKDANRQIASIKELARIQLEVAIETMQSEAKIYLATRKKVEDDKKELDNQFLNQPPGMGIFGSPRTETADKIYESRCLSNQQQLYIDICAILDKKVEYLKALKSKLE